MESIRAVLDRKLLEATDRAARRAKKNRSSLIRDAIREYPHTLEIRELEQRDREGYLKNPQSAGEVDRWAAEAKWPVDAVSVK
jgi:metal-responsive CopG/Arc/MetJ family transcriptional regulator